MIEQPTNDQVDVWLKLSACEDRIEFVTTPARAFVLVSQLQLALRHWGNSGPSAEIAEEIAVNLSEAICHFVPEVRPYIDQGWNPAHDVTQEYFNQEF